MNRLDVERGMLLYAVTDRSRLAGRSLTSVCEEALSAGVTMLQLREKHLPRKSLIAEGKALAALCRKYGVPFVVNDDVEAAIACGADGAHVGQSDTGAKEARAALGPGRILGVSASTVEQAVRAEREGADYIGVGAVFPTSTKSDADTVSYATLSAICRAVSVPVVAIGGITEENLPRLTGSGVDGAAVVSAIFSAKDVPEAVRGLRRAAARMVVNSYQNYLFDLDGTLVDSMPFWKNSPGDFLAANGYAPPAGIYEAMKAMDMRASAAYLKERFGFPGKTAEEVRREMDAFMAGRYAHEIGLKPGVRAFLEQAVRAGKRLGLVTATDRELAEPCLSRLGVLPYFSAVVTCTEEGLNKERGDVYRVAAERLEARAEDTLVFEDALHAVRASVSAGLKTVGVYEACAPEEAEEARKTAQLYLQTFEELTEVGE